MYIISHYVTLILFSVVVLLTINIVTMQCLQLSPQLSKPVATVARNQNSIDVKNKEQIF